MSLLTEMFSDGPGGQWMMDTADDVTLASTLTFGGSPPTAASIIPSVLTDSRDFNGSSQNATATDKPVLDLGDVFTLECWMVIDTLPGPGVPATMIYKHTAYQLTVFNGQVSLARPGVAIIASTTLGVSAGLKL